MVQLYGQPYHPNTLSPVQPDENALMNRVSIFIFLLLNFRDFRGQHVLFVRPQILFYIYFYYRLYLIPGKIT